MGEISDQVAQGISEIGLLYVAQKQLSAFLHILDHRKLSFETLTAREICVYIGPNHPRYHDKSIDFSELAQLRLIRGIRDFFSMEHHLAKVSLGSIGTEEIEYAVYTNSNHLTVNLLLQTDACLLGLDLMFQQYEQYDIKTLRINNCEPVLTVGYIYPERSALSEAAEWFLTQFRALL